MSAVVQGIVSTRDCAWSGGYSAFLICCAAHTTINGFVLEDQPAQLQKSKNKKERKNIFSPQNFVVPSHPAEIWCRKKYSSKVKKAIMKISWKGMILDWKGARCSPSGRTKGAILTLSGKWDSLDCWDSCYTARCFFKKRLLSQIPRTFNNGMLVPRTWFNLKSRAIWKQEGQI